MSPNDVIAAEWTADATVVIAFFTVILAIVSCVQGWLTFRAIALARAEFNATHRPRIIVLTCEVAHDGEGDLIGAHLSMVNAGDTDAAILSIESKIILATALTPGVVLDSVPSGVRRLPSGAEVGIPVFGETLELAVARRNKPGEPALWCVGRVTYSDGLNVRRRTGFCRLYDQESRSWVRENNPDFEYAY